MPRALILYIALLMAGQIAGNGYAFLFDYTWGQIVLLSYFASLAAYGWYQYNYDKKKSA